MGLESWITKIQTKRMDKFCKDTRGLKYQLIAEQKNGSVLKTATRDEDVYIVVEEQGINRIVAGFIKKYNDCYFITYHYGGTQMDFGKLKDLLIYKRYGSIYAKSQIDGKEIYVKFFEDQDKELKYEHHGISSCGIGCV